MQVSLSRFSSRILLIGISLICACTLSIAAGRMWTAAHLAATRNATDWKRAIRIEPGNADYWNQLGLYEEWDLAEGHIQQAIQDFTRATELNPHLDLLWINLANAYEVSGRPGAAREAYKKALAAHPVSAEVVWRYGSFLLRQGQTRQAAEQIHQALEDRPDLAASAVSQFFEAGVGLDQILRQVLPARRRDYLAAVDYFVSQQNVDAALACWKKLVGLHQEVPLTRAFKLTDSLIVHRRSADAAVVWRQALVAAGRESQFNVGGSLVFNGGFEQNLANGGFGWHQKPFNGSVFDLVGDVTHGGAQSARLIFDGTVNTDFSGLRQYVAIAPARHYRFSAFMRTDGISTDSGPQFVIRTCGDPAQPLAQTGAMTGTHPWVEVQTEFTAGANEHCADVMLRRVPSRMFDNKIRGTVWVDDVRLIPAPATGGRTR